MFTAGYIQTSLLVIPAWFWILLTFVMGAIVGSFLNVCIHRMPRGHSIVSPRSHCYGCGKTIAWYDNIPLLSFLLLKGKCRDCKASYSIRYWLVELLTALLFVAAWKSFPTPQALAITIFICGLIVATFIDFEHYIIPDEITLGGIVVGFLLSGLIPALQHESLHTFGALWSAVGIATGWISLWIVVELGKRLFGIKKTSLSHPSEIILTARGLRLGEEIEPWEEIFSRESDIFSFQAVSVRFGNKSWDTALIRVNWKEIDVQGEIFPLEAMTGELRGITDTLFIPREAMGFGDVKFLAAIGAFLGPKAIFFIIFLSSLSGSLVGLLTIAIGKREWGLKLPYGPYLAFAALFWVFWGETLLQTYMIWIGR